MDTTTRFPIAAPTMAGTIRVCSSSPRGWHARFTSSSTTSSSTHFAVARTLTTLGVQDDCIDSHRT